MSVIKFRAWDKDKNRMSDVCDISFGDDGSARTIVFQTVTKERYYRGLVEGENGILMQFTGLYDKSRKEIYEGDILCWHGDKEHPISVFYEAGEGSWMVKRNASENEYLANIAGFSEVVGNIYENPDLAGGEA